MTKQMIAIAPQARKIDARNGGSITKNRITPENSAKRLAMIATMTHIRRTWADIVMADSGAPRTHLRDGARLLEVP